MKRDIQSLIAKMTLEEKAGMCSGLDFWRLKGVERLGIPSIMVTDGPHGLRKQQEKTDHLGISQSVPATCFPSAAGMASSWDRELIHDVGVALGEECQAEDVAVLLGPGANIKRSPLCGRNFEYFSEDPFLSSEMATGHIQGVQSQGVGTSLKHFAANNQEHRRSGIDTIVDQRTLREIYLASFEGPVKNAQPWTVMSAYNKVNGTFASENEFLLTDILKEEWGHEGFVVTDWGANNDRVDGLLAGQELEMPSSGGANDRKIIEAVQNGMLSEELLNRAVERILRIIFMSVDNKKPNATYDKDEHHRLARTVAGETMVLLKNEDDLLPLAKGMKLAIVGPFAQKPRYQGGGSSHINPTQLDVPIEKIKKLAGDSASIVYAQGFHLESDDLDTVLIEEAKEAAGKADAVVIFAGLPDRYESEGYDRKHLHMPANQSQLIEEIASVQSNVIVVLMNGSAIEMPWINQAKSILEAYLGGQAAGGAIADLLFGEVNPSGKLTETFPMKLSDTPSFLFFPGEGNRVEYREGIFVGYRYHDTKQVKPLFPFGHGLSYTTFEYSNLVMDNKGIKDTDTVNVHLTVQNRGSRTGKEVVQLYVRDVQSTVMRPFKELKGFTKIELQPGEKKTVTFKLDHRSFAYYNVDIKDWYVESGNFEIMIGRSCEDILLSDTIHVQSTVALKLKVDRNTMMIDLMSDPKKAPIAQGLIMQIQKGMGLMLEGSEAAENLGEGTGEILTEMLNYMPLRMLAMMSQGMFTEEMLDGLIQQLNNN
ncbi:beta-glucosidase [Paenibacillus terrigena]|uniref:beta-glucosidase n=1 Tax=Paenibacillus terrigena TaxID=369333 RepID=UPI00037FF604|nr:glycoside hydrolase family 3 C-terminal domain-containing protein [Paenibacillus terrigena]